MDEQPVACLRLVNHCKSFVRLRNADGELDVESFIGGSLDAEKLGLLFGLSRNIANSCYEEYMRAGDIKKLDLALVVERDILEAQQSQELESDQATSFNNIGLYLCEKFKRQGELDDLNEAIKMAKSALEILQKYDEDSEYHDELARCTTNLGMFLHQRSLRTGSIGDLDIAVRLLDGALEVPFEDEDMRSTMCNILANIHHERFEQRGSLDDLEASISSMEQAIGLLNDSHLDRALYLNNLSNFLHSRYDRTGERADLDASIANAQEACEIERSSDAHVEDTGCATTLSNLSNKLGERHDCTGDIADLEEAILRAKEAMDLIPADYPGRNHFLNTYSILLSQRYHITGALEDLHETIKLGEEALRITPHDEPSRPTYLNNLSCSLAERYKRLETFRDLEVAIEEAHEAVELTPREHPARPGYLNCLSGVLYDRYERVDDFADLEEASRYSHEAIALAPKNHPGLAVYIQRLGSVLYAKYNDTEAAEPIKELEESIKAIRSAMELTPKDHPRQSMLSNTLGCMMHAQFRETKEIEFLQESAEATLRAINSMPDSMPSKADYLWNLGGVVIDFHGVIPQNDLPIHLPSAIDCYRKAYEVENGTPFIRIKAGWKAAELYAHSLRWEDAYKLLEGSLRLLPWMCQKSLEREDLQHVLGQMSGLSSFAASIALQVGKPASEAIEALELGRCVIARLIVDSKSDISALEEVNATLVTQYRSLRDEVSATLSTTGVERGGDYPSAAALARRHDAVFELAAMEDRIRQLPGFTNFQVPPCSKDWKHLALEGPIVAFNITTIRSDALIVSQNGTVSLKLPDLKHQDIVQNVETVLGSIRGPMRTYPERNKKVNVILDWLWTTAVKPVLSALGYLNTCVDIEHSPHVYWLSTGLISLLPLHAAGKFHRGKRSSENTMEYVISSYVTSIQSLIHLRNKSNHALAQEDRNVCIVAMQETPGRSQLEVEDEIIAIQSAVPSTKTIQVFHAPSRASVLESLTACSLTHFICHGVSNNKDPSTSGLVVFDAAKERTEILSIRDLAGMNQQHARIAYLSACSTAENSARPLLDEAIHLANAFQQIGFAHVIGTLWEAEDDSSVAIAGSFYNSLFAGQEGFIGHKKVARALHLAVKALMEDEPECPLSWAPFVHVGV